MCAASTRVTLLVFVCLTISSAGNAVAEDGEFYSGTITDKRVKTCGVIVSWSTRTWIQLHLVGGEDLAGRLVLTVSGESASGKTQSTQFAEIAHGSLRHTVALSGSLSALTVDMNVMDAVGKTICELSQTIEPVGRTIKI